MNAIYFLAEEGPNASLSWLLWVALGFFLLMVIVGWLVSRNKGSQPAVQPVAHAEPAAPVVKEKTVDDLVVLEGIGPKVAKVLNEAGITSFADLADADVDKVRATLAANGMRYMDPAGWIEQAKLAAAGDTEGLRKLQSELKGGRRIS